VNEFTPPGSRSIKSRRDEQRPVLVVHQRASRVRAANGANRASLRSRRSCSRRPCRRD